MSFENSFNISNLALNGRNVFSNISSIPDLNTEIYMMPYMSFNMFPQIINPTMNMDTFNFSPFGFNSSFNNYFNVQNNNFKNIDWGKLWDASIEMCKQRLMMGITPQKSYNPSDNNDHISKLAPEMQQKTQQLLDYALSQGLSVSITSGYRTEEEQARLYATNPNAAKNSLHTQGKAIDISIKNGTDADYKLLGDYAKSIGMRWGGDFKNPRPERWHFDLGWA